MNRNKQFALVGVLSFAAGYTLTAMTVHKTLDVMQKRLDARKDMEKFLTNSMNELATALQAEYTSPEAQRHINKFMNDMRFAEEFYK